MSEPRSSRRAKKAVNYEEPKPLSTREIRARMSQDSEEKKSRKRANSEASAGSSSQKKPKASTTPAPKKPAAKKTPRRLEDTLAAEVVDEKEGAARRRRRRAIKLERARAAAVSTEADESTKATRAEARAWRDKYRALEKERVTQAEREKDRSDGRAARPRGFVQGAGAAPEGVRGPHGLLFESLRARGDGRRGGRVRRDVELHGPKAGI